MPDDKQMGLLEDLLHSGTAIRQYLEGVSYEAFVANTEKQDAVLRRFEILGEAASRLTPETKALFPDIPFRAMRGMRNIIAHDYGDIDIDQVWKTAATDIIPMIAAIENYFSGR